MRFLLLITAGYMLWSCTQQSTQGTSSQPDDTPGQVFTPNNNPPADGFDVEGSDVTAVVIADKVMNAMGGRPAWDSVRYLSWNFFGARKLLWDKLTGDVRIDNLGDDRIVLMNIKDDTGRVFKDGSELMHQDSVAKYLDWGKRVWINDSYWLVMPFKLKDTGVTLNYLGSSQTLVGEAAEKLRLTFEGVGVTPENAYEVWVSNETDLITQWAYFRNASDSMAQWTLPWGNYREMNGILLADDRGERDLSEVQVLESVPPGIFESFDPSL